MNDDPNAHPGEPGQGPVSRRRSRPPGGGGSDGPAVPRRPRSPHRGEPFDDAERESFGGAERPPYGHDGPGRPDLRRGDLSGRDDAPRSRRARHGSLDSGPEPDDTDGGRQGGSDESSPEGPTVGRAAPVPPRRSGSRRRTGGPLASGGPGGPGGTLASGGSGGSGGPGGSGGAGGPGGPGTAPISGGPRPPAIVGRASVRSSPGSGPGAGRHSTDELGEANVDDAFDDLGGDGPGGGGPGGPRDGGPGDGGSRANRSARARKARRRNMILASFAVFIMLAGISVVVGAYYVDGIKTPDQLTFPESTTVYYSDGTVLAKLGQVTRYNLTFEQMNDAVKEAVVASEDKTFWTNSGVDFASVLRAAWNNFTGGQTQGASTITQQYARLAFDLQGTTYSRKIREAILAWKLDDQLSKDKILEYYLNAVPFGRNTYGIEAAAQAFFGKTANRHAKVASQLTKADAMVLVSMIKQPAPDPTDPKGHPGYDPTYSPLALKQSQDRFEYVRQQMKDLGYLTPQEDAALKFPLSEVHKYDPTLNAGYGMDSPAGLVVNHVLSELSHSDNQNFANMPWQDIRDGGYKIYTTLDRNAQAAAEAAADETRKGSFMYGQPKQLQAALVAVQPGTGRIVAYYGGHNGNNGGDYAGIYFDEQGQGNGFGRQPAGSSFKVYTLAAALNSGISLNSYWESKPHDLPGRTGNNQVTNSGTCATGADQPCSLLQSTIDSLNVPFYEVTMSVTPEKVLEMARAAGIDNMWNDARVRQNLVGADLTKLVPSTFDTVLGIGQYPVTVMDHANGLATFAAGGLRATAHFVTKVLDGDKIVYSEKLPSGNEPRILSPEAENDLTYALSKVAASTLNNGWNSAGKTGTWELGTNHSENADAWMTGFTRRLAAAVWVGNKGPEKALRDKNNNQIYGAGIPASIWRSFMTNATRAMKLNPDGTNFNPPSFAGSTSPPGSVPPPDQNKGPGQGGCVLIFFCPPGRRG